MATFNFLVICYLRLSSNPEKLPVNAAPKYSVLLCFCFARQATVFRFAANTVRLSMIRANNNNCRRLSGLQVDVKMDILLPSGLLVSFVCCVVVVFYRRSASSVVANS